MSSNGSNVRPARFDAPSGTLPQLVSPSEHKANKSRVVSIERIWTSSIETQLNPTSILPAVQAVRSQR
jgi:hypothetical protein